MAYYQMDRERERERETRKRPKLTRNLHDISRHNVSSFDPLDGRAVHAVNFAHLWLVLLQSLDGALCIPLLRPYNKPQ